MQYTLFSDGGSRGNPGKSACGYLIFEEGFLYDFGANYLGIGTNNNAEYLGLISGLKLAIKREINELQCYLDSELVVKQINGLYKINNLEIKKHCEEINILKTKFKVISFNHVPRKNNSFADKLVNMILDSSV